MSRSFQNPTFVALLAFLATAPTAVVAQGSAGGSIGNDDKEILGARSAKEPAQPDAGKADETRRAFRSGNSNSFDGAWTFVGVSTNCGGTATLPAIISGGKLIAKGATGQVSANGMYRGIAMGADGITLSASGRFFGNGASGTYRRADGCIGRWTASRN
jgi:hypothetical protein